MAAAETQTPEVRAEARFVRVSPRKARLVVDHIRGRSVPEARTILAFTTRAVAVEVEKVLKSAVSNAEANLQWHGDELVISAAYVDEGPTIKRWRARARGRVSSIKKRTCHITIKVAQPNGSGAQSQHTATTEQPKRKADSKPAAKTRAKKKEATA